MLVLWVVSVSACKTARPMEGPTILVEPNLSPPGDPHDEEPASGESRPAPLLARHPSLAAEPLTPVRGGARVLAPYRGPEPCQMALTGDSPVARACSEGGQRKAIDLMQDFVKRAKTQNIVFQCGDCHLDEDDYMKLTPHADAQFRKLLFIVHP